MGVILETTNINKFFNKPVRFQALKNISLKIQAGEFVSIMGKSGCGKSTLLYILSTMDTDYEGELFIDGKKMTGQSSEFLARIRNQHIGFVFQFHYLVPEFTVLENVMLPAKKLGIKTPEQIRHDALMKLNLLGIEDQADKKAYMLSGGQKQRVSIARALINNPKIIMGDEPTGNNVFQIFKQLSMDINLSLLIVTHDHDFAQKTHRIIQMEDGEIH